MVQVRWGILGPVEVSDAERSIALGGPKQRAVLAALLLHANEVVSRGRLIELVWDERPPEHVGQSLDSYISRLRKLLGADRLLRQGSGYTLRVGPGELDLERFEAAVERARDQRDAGDVTEAARTLGDALALWRGHALADVLYEGQLGREAHRLDERRLLALEARIDAELSRGEARELAVELEQLVADHPFRESFVAQLALAHVRSGRQSDALRVLREARHRLAGELGLDLSPELRELERRILQQDPTLAAPTRAHGRRGRPARRGFILGAAAAAALISVGAVLVAVRDRSAEGLGAESRSSRLLSLDLDSRRSRQRAELPGEPVAMLAAHDSVWLADPAQGVVLRADPSTGRIVDRVQVDGQPGSLAAGGGGVWVAGTVGGEVHRIDPGTGTVSQTVRLGQANTSALVFDRGLLWVADTTDQALVAIDPQTGVAERTVTLNVRPTALAGAGDGTLWVAASDAGTVSEVDLRSGQTLATVRVGNGPSALAVGRGSVWVANALDATVSRVDADTAAVVATIPVGSGPSALALAGRSLWVANGDAGTVSRVDTESGRVSSTIVVGGRPNALVATARHLWVGAAPSAGTHRGGTLTLATAGWFPSFDPSFYTGATPPQFSGLAYDGLVTFAHTAGPAGLRLVPDLALQVPAPGAGGRTWAFRLRPGIRYSDGRSVVATDFRRTFERLFRARSPAAASFSSLLGAAACRRRPAGCDLSRGVTTSDRLRSIVFNLTAPDPDFLLKLTSFGFSAPIPPGTPDRDLGMRAAIPGTGPYRIVRATAREVRFERNPFFREWSHAAQPAGNPDVIVWRRMPSRGATIRAILDGTADWTWDLISPGRFRDLRARSPEQVHVNPAFVVEFLPLNTHRPPFDDVRVRRALNFAIDRSKIAEMYGGAAVAVPTCQPLVPGLLGFRRYCPYTADPNSGGRWSAPDLRRARRLVAASGTRGQIVDVWGATNQIALPEQEAEYVGGVLRSLGYRARVHAVPYSSITQRQRERFQLSTDGDWIPDFPAPSAYLPQFFGCGGAFSNGYVCNRDLDRRMREAQLLQVDDPSRAAAAWAAVDRQITDDAYWVPTVTLRYEELVSKRLRGYQFHPAWGFLADQAWVSGA